MRKLNSTGLAHHVIVMLLVVLGVAGFGAYSVLKANAESYDSHVTIRTSGNDGRTVSFKTVTHTLGLCNPHFETITTASSITCDGNSMGSPEALNVYVSSVPSGYKLTGWTVTSNNTNGSVSCITTNCRVSFDNGSATITANFVATSTPTPPPPTQPTDSYVTVNTTGNDGHSASFKTTPHTLGSCGNSFSVATTKMCSGFAMGSLTLSVSTAPSGYKLSSFTVTSNSTNGTVSCSTSCTISFDNGSATVTANFTKETTDSSLTINTMGNDKHSVTFATAYHELGSCGSSFSISTTKKCSGFSLGYPDRLILSVAKAPTGYTFTGWHVTTNQKVTVGKDVYCNSTCSINIGAGSSAVSANFKKTPKPESVNVGRDGYNGPANCVSFVNYIIGKEVKGSPRALANGSGVASYLGSHYGFTTNHTPAVNAVVSMTSSQSAGHTAIVSQVNSDGSIEVNESNWPDGVVYHGGRHISAGAAHSYLYAHTEDKWRN